jgi:hypothetical protein
MEGEPTGRTIMDLQSPPRFLGRKVMGSGIRDEANMNKALQRREK